MRPTIATRATGPKDARWPALWDGLLAHWAPILGNQGHAGSNSSPKFYDWSGRLGAHLTQNALNASNMWGNMNSGPGFLFGGTNAETGRTIAHGIGTGPFAIFARATPNAVSAANRGLWGNGTFAPGFYITSNQSGGVWGMYWSAWKLANTVVTLNYEHTLCCCRSKGGTGTFFLDGVNDGSPSISGLNMADAEWACGNPRANNASNVADAYLLEMAIWDRELSSAEVQMLHCHPAAISHRRRAPVLFSIPPVAGGDMSATLPITLGLSANLTAKGNISATLPISITQTSTLTGIGALAATLPITIGQSSDLAGTGALSASLPITVGLSADLTDGSALPGPISATLPISLGLSANLTAKGALSATLPITLGLSSQITATAQISATLPITLGLTASLIDSAAVVGGPYCVEEGDVYLAGGDVSDVYISGSEAEDDCQ